MKNIYSLYKLRMNVVIKSAVLVIPIIALFVFLDTMYAVIPTQVSGSFLISGVFLFIISAYIALSIQDRENDVHEEILLLHSRSKVYYYISRELVTLSITLVFSLILTLYPLFKFKMNANTFRRPLEAADVIYGGIIILANGLCGIAVGDMFHQRILTVRRNRIIVAVFVMILALCKYGLIKSCGFLKFLNLILPPVMDALYMVGDSDIFDPRGTLGIFIHTIVFAIVVAFVKIKLLMKNKYTA